VAAVHEFRAVAGRLELTFPGRCVRSFLDLGGIDRAVVLSAQAFTALIPLLILVAALTPAGEDDVVSVALVGRFGLSGDAADAVHRLFDQPGDGTVGALSAALLLFSAISLTRRVQGMYLSAWHLQALRGVRSAVDAALGLTVLVAAIGALYLVRSLVGGLPAGSVLVPVLVALLSTLLWVTLPWLLLARRIGWRRLVPTGAITAAGTTLYALTSTVYMPRLLESYSRRYGLFGITLALVGWLLVVTLVLVASTAVAAELDGAQDPWAVRLRRALGNRADLPPGTPPLTGALPPPQPPRRPG